MTICIRNITIKTIFTEKHFVEIILALNKHILAIIFVITLLSATSLQADEFKILSFQRVEKDISAIIIANKRTDAMDDICAIIKVRSDFRGIHFAASNPVVGDIEWVNGEYWVYLSGRTRELSFFADGFVKYSYLFPQVIEAGKVYILSITSKSGIVIERAKGSLSISSKPVNVKVSIDGIPDLNKQTPCNFTNYLAKKYRFSFTKNRYYPLDTILSIVENTQKHIDIQLKPRWGNLLVETTLDNVNYEINDTSYVSRILSIDGESNGLDPGIYQLKISKPNYNSINMQVEILEAQIAKYKIELKPITTNISIESSPAGAYVFSDGNYLGNTPLNQQMIIGKHKLRIVKEDFLDEKLYIELKEGTFFKELIHLRNHTKIQINSVPDGAKVHINGIYLGKTPLNANVKTGNSKIRLHKENYQLLEEEIDIGDNQSLSFNLKGKQYRLRIASKPTGSSIIVNDKAQGQTPNTIYGNYKRYKIKLNKEGFYSASKRIKLKSDKTVFKKLNKVLAGYLGVSWMPKQSNYDIYKFGFELGWSYKKAKHLFTGIGLLFNTDSNILDILPNDGMLGSITPINTSDISNMDLNTMPLEGFAEEKVYLGLLKLGIIIPKPFVFSLGAGVGWYNKIGYNIYKSNKYYHIGDGGVILLDDLFYDPTKQIVRNDIIYSINIIIPIGNIYIMGEYWVSNNIINFTPEYSLGFGYSFNP